MTASENNTIIGILRSIKDITNVFDVNDSLKLRVDLSYSIYIRDVSYFNSKIEDYHILFGHYIDTSVIHIVIKKFHILIDEDKNIFIHVGPPNTNGWIHLHLNTNEIYDDNVSLCLKHGRIIFEEV